MKPKTDRHLRSDAPSEAHLQDEFAEKALLREQGVHPRLALSRVPTWSAQRPRLSG